MALRKFTFFNATEGFAEEQQATDELSLGKVTAVGVSGIAIDASSQRIVNVASPTAGTDAANRDYVQAWAAGLDWKQSVRLIQDSPLAAVTAAGSGVGKTLTANANGALSIDGVATVAADRVLIAGQAAGADNGIYIVTDAGSAGTPFILTRSTDADTNAEVTAGLAMFIEEGTSWGDTGWVLTTNNPITVDTTALVFSQFTGTGSIIAGAGLLKTGNTLDVELDTAAGAQTAGSGGGSSGLEFDTSGVAGKLRAAVHATAGLERLSGGLAVKLNGTTLQSAAGGLSVKGLPALFEIATVATSANVTAANLGTLTAGPTSDASALHSHSKDIELWLVNANVAKGEGVYIGAADAINPGANTADASSRIIGVADTTTAAAGTAQVLVHGTCTAVLSGATFNVPYYLGATGAPILYASLAANARVVRLGFAKNATDLAVRIFDYGKKA